MLEVKAVNSWGEQDEVTRIPLVRPNGVNEYALRYVWISHRDDNRRFIDNYFVNKNDQGLNIRKQSQHLQSFWQYHNAVFDQSADNGDLIWRVKVHNKHSDTVDYIEVWKSREILEQHFGSGVPLRSEGWDIEKASALSKGIYDLGFCVKNWLPFQTMSKSQAREWYQMFKFKSQQKQNCIINTAMRGVG